MTSHRESLNALVPSADNADGMEFLEKLRSIEPRDPRLLTGAGAAVLLGILIAFALVFATAVGTSALVDDALALQQAEAALGAVANSTAALQLAALAPEELEGELARDARAALSRARRAMSDLEAEPAAQTAYLDSAQAVLRGEGEVDGLLPGLGAAHLVLMDELVDLRQAASDSVTAAGDSAGRATAITRFLVAFLVPLGAAGLYLRLARWRDQARVMEERLEKERDLRFAKDSFVANVSHELRTPLTTVLGFAELLAEGKVHDESERREMLNLIYGQSAELARMVEDLLTTARLDAGGLHYSFQDVGLKHELEEVCRPFDRMGVPIRFEIPDAVVSVDRLRFRQVVRNLIANARKYGGENVWIEAAEVDGLLRLSVADDGDGVPPGLETVIFDRFATADGHRPFEQGGVGLGLPIVRTILEGMGGKIEYQRREGVTRFSLILPLAPLGERIAGERIAGERRPGPVPQENMPVRPPPAPPGQTVAAKPPTPAPVR